MITGLCLLIALALGWEVAQPNSPALTLQPEATSEPQPPQDVIPADAGPVLSVEASPAAQPTLAAADVSATATQVYSGVLAASVYRNWHWDIYTLSPDGQLLRRLTFGEGDNRAPSWSPDGKQIAFESNRNQNWDIYIVNSDGTGLQRLTDEPHFDGSPRWSPDGQHIAFTSDRSGDNDIWIMHSDGSAAVDLTPGSPAPNFDPTWSPDGMQIAFTSMRDGNKAIYVMNADGTNMRRLSPAGAASDEQPAWSPDGRRIAFISEAAGARELYIMDAGTPARRQRITALAYHQWPAWSPDGTALLLVAQSEDGQDIERTRPGRPPVQLTYGPFWYRQPDWNAQADTVGDPQSLARTDAPLYVENPTPNPPERPDRYNLVKLNYVHVIVPLLSDTVVGSFNAARQRIIAETGWDFFAQLSEAARPLTFKSNASDYLSWHKAGRAIDVAQAYTTPQGQALEIAREDVLGETYWRLYLRTAKQDGSQGEPLREALWDVSGEARARAPAQGGLIKGVLPGYYVDLTELLRQYGWRRIAAHTEPDFDWRRDYQALEFWHYEKTDNLTWWQAIQQIYAPKDLGDMFSYDALVRAQYDVATIIEKGVPVPASLLQHYDTLQP